MFDENGHEYCFYNSCGMKSKATQSFQLTLEQTLFKSSETLDPLLPLSSCAKLQCEVVQPGLEPKALEFSKRIFSEVLQS